MLNDDSADDDDDEILYNNYENEKPEIFLSLKHKTDLNSLIAVLAPIGHTYLAVVHSLKYLLNGSLLENDFIKYALEEIKRRVASGECKYGKHLIVVFLPVLIFIYM